LSSHIFRYNHHNLGGSSGLGSNIHTINEHIYLTDFLEQIRFFVTLILDADEAEL
jgi:Gly-Xaa carboxypeptidase